MRTCVRSNFQKFILKKVIDIEEIWKDVKDYEGLYQVSNLGNIRSVDRIINHQYDINTGIKNKTRTIYGKLLKLYIGKTGYFQVTLSSQKRKPKVVYIHRLVAQAFIPNPKNLPEVNHKDENKLNNKVENLEWCTRDYNAKYSAKLHPR